MALYFAVLLKNFDAEQILRAGFVASSEDATVLSKFFWDMVNRSAEDDVKIPCEGSSQYWTEKLYNSIGGYLETAGYEKEWNTEVDNA